MTETLPSQHILVSGTMRGGSSLISNVLNAHSKIMILGEYVHFFRFLYGYYEPLNRENVERMLKEMHARLYWRYRVEIDVPGILADVDAHGYDYRSIYDSIMRHYLSKLGREVAGEDAALNWRAIPQFLSLFPDGKVLQIVRDPRSVLSSWQKISYQKANYLGTIFNCIDALDYCARYERTLPSDTFMWVRYEDLVSNPEEHVRRITKFVGQEFEEAQVRPDLWDDIFDGVYLKHGWSSHTGKETKFFDTSRMDTWRDTLEDWQLCLVETLAKERLEHFGYEPAGKTFDGATMHKGLDMLRSTPWLYKLSNIWLAQNEGHDGYADDPRDPATWGATGQNKALFLDTDDGRNYLKAIDEIRSGL